VYTTKKKIQNPFKKKKIQKEQKRKLSEKWLGTPNSVQPGNPSPSQTTRSRQKKKLKL